MGFMIYLSQKSPKHFYYIWKKPLNTVNKYQKPVFTQACRAKSLYKMKKIFEKSLNDVKKTIKSVEKPFNHKIKNDRKRTQK